MRHWPGLILSAALIIVLIPPPEDRPREARGRPPLSTELAAAAKRVAAKPKVAAKPVRVRLQHGEAAARLARAGIRTKSSGKCSDRKRPYCTSLTGIRRQTIDGVIGLRRRANCRLVVTGGTEVGHAKGKYSHEKGYKIDINPGKCINGHITGKFRRYGTRSDGAELYRPIPRPDNTYARESHHWDITFR